MECIDQNYSYDYITNDREPKRQVIGENCRWEVILENCVVLHVYLVQSLKSPILSTTFLNIV